MLLTDYTAPSFKAGKTLTALCYDSRVSWKTVIKAASHALPVGHEVALKLSAATDGRCSYEEIRDPRAYMSAAKRAAFEADDRKRERKSRTRARAA
jgi:hypothetical protein